MENASKALLMAGGILIALLVLGSLLLMFANLENYQNKTDISTKQAQIAKFNNQFEPYNKKELTLMELKSIYNKILSNNKKYEEYPEYQIDHNIDSNLFNDNYQEDISSIFFTKKFSDLPETEKANRKFKCTRIEYRNRDGRINYMEFEDITGPVESYVDVNV